jgi:E3 ubiquitin-protein ligase SHPRH
MYNKLFTEYISSMLSGCLYLTERAAGRHQKWIMCPTCRQRTYLENVAFVVEKQSENADKQAEDLAESAISVQGSYGTKVSFVFLYL